MRVYQLLKAGVPLHAIIGQDELPASLADWLIEIDAVYREWEDERMAKAMGAE